MDVKNKLSFRAGVTLLLLVIGRTILRNGFWCHCMKTTFCLSTMLIFCAVQATRVHHKHLIRLMFN
jgi:hypothetical protein